MAVSKRLRFEVLRRDNHTCRYCGQSAPDVTLTIDHVIPEALGGTDDPGNLVAACTACNGGKSSSSPDAALVADVSQAAVRWSAAMQQAAQENRLNDNTAVYEAVVNAWSSFRRNQIPADYRETIDQFLEAGLPSNDVVQMAHVADAKPSIYNRWAYFCGCCWTRIRQLQERATEIVAANSDMTLTPAGAASSDTLTTRVSRSQIKTSLRSITARLVEVSGHTEEAITDLSNYSCIHEDNLAECGDLVCAYVALAEFFIDAYATGILTDAREHPPTSRGWFKSVWYSTAWNLGHRTWRQIVPQEVDEARAESEADGRRPGDQGYVNEDGYIHTTNAPRPLGFFDDVDYFLAKGLERSKIERNVVEAFSAPLDDLDRWSYFRGCCRRDLAADPPPERLTV